MPAVVTIYGFVFVNRLHTDDASCYLLDLFELIYSIQSQSMLCYKVLWVTVQECAVHRYSFVTVLYCTGFVFELKLALMPALKPSWLITLPHTVHSVRNNNYHLCNELLDIVFLLGDFHQHRAENCVAS